MMVRKNAVSTVSKFYDRKTNDRKDKLSKKEIPTVLTYNSCMDCQRKRFIIMREDGNVSVASVAPCFYYISAK